VQEFSPNNAETLIGDADIVLDATDNMETRFLINDACVKLGKPWIYASAAGGACMSMFILPKKTPCLRCVFKHLKTGAKLPTAQTVGIASMTAHTAACLEVAQALKWISSGEYEDGMVYFDVWNMDFSKVLIKRDKKCPSCRGK
jgi:adenylyltransferase/sulfurtransferase